MARSVVERHAPITWVEKKKRRVTATVGDAVATRLMEFEVLGAHISLRRRGVRAAAARSVQSPPSSETRSAEHKSEKAQWRNAPNGSQTAGAPKVAKKAGAELRTGLPQRFARVYGESKRRNV